MKSPSRKLFEKVLVLQLPHNAELGRVVVEVGKAFIPLPYKGQKPLYLQSELVQKGVMHAITSLGLLIIFMVITKSYC